jgi:hypothetical protein
MHLRTLRARIVQSRNRALRTPEHASDHSREMREHRAWEQDQERTNAALRRVVIRPVRPLLISCPVSGVSLPVMTSRQQVNTKSGRRRDPVEVRLARGTLSRDHVTWVSQEIDDTPPEPTRPLRDARDSARARMTLVKDR